MADSRPWIEVPTTWTNIYARSGIAVGTALEVGNMSTANIRLCIAANMPAVDQIGTMLSAFGSFGSIATVTGASTGLWAKAVTNGGRISVTEK